MKVWTVVSQEDTDSGSDHLVVGSYTSRGRALDECVKYIFERLKWREAFARSMAHDEIHPEAEEFFSEREDGRTVVREGCVEKLRRYVRDVLGGDGAYYVFDGTDSWHFDVDENDVEGELWYMVTWGSGVSDDPEFANPRPEAFTSKDAAIEEFYRYALDLKQQYEVGVSEGFRSLVYDLLRKNGTCQVDLPDGCCVSCVLYHDDAKNIKE